MIGVIVNPRSGFVARHGVDHVRSLIDTKLEDTRILVLEEHQDVRRCTQDLLSQGAACVTAVGGDGTVSAVASLLAGGQTPLGVVPAGTLNHFARDVGVGRDVSQALDVLAAGFVLPVDVAAVNERIFVNNSSIGLYPRMVEIRERYERRLGKWRAAFRAAILVTRQARSTVVDLMADGRQERLHSYLVFVGNNQYEMDLLHLGQRVRLDAGELSCFIFDVPSRVRLVPQVYRFLRDTHPQRHVLRSFTTNQLTLIPRRGPTVEVSADGEVFSQSVPLVYRVLPKALNVVVPEPPPPESREIRSATD